MAGIGSDITKRLFTDAGIGAGMRVLDLGCGPGDVSILAAELVGPNGFVFGIDRDQGALEIAKQKVKEANFQNIEFSQINLEKDSFDEKYGLFDAVVTRRVLMYLSNPVAVIRSVCAVLKPGGIVAVHEHDLTLVPAGILPLPLHNKAYSWIKKTLEHENVDPNMGFKLHTTLTQAGLRVDHIRAEAILSTPEQPTQHASLLRVMLPRMIASGAIKSGEIDFDDFEKKLALERQNSPAVYMTDLAFTAWAHKLNT